MIGRIIKYLVVTSVVAAFIVAGVLYYAATNWRSQAPAEVEIAPGSSVSKMADTLAKSGVIRMPKLFTLVARIKGSAGKLKAGTYEFESGTTMLAALEKIERGEVKQYPFTIIEGWRIDDIVKALSEQPFTKGSDIAQKFKTLVRDPTFITSLGLGGADSLEGYLFPDTYLITKPVTAEMLLKRFISRFREVWQGMGFAGKEVSGLDERQTLTLASLIEKETAASAERPLVASVFMNRLAKGMLLQSDPTIIYGLENFNGNIHKSDITNPHPYNTYVHPGLPPGPICNPGKASIEAAMRPAKSNVLYFVAKGDGTHFFSENLADHNAAVTQYQLRGGGGEKQ